MNDYATIEAELQKRRIQADSVRGKDTPFRAEFRYRHGTKHWQYFTSLAEALVGTDSSCTYGPTGRAIVETPTSIQIQVRGPRGGWRKYAHNRAISHKLSAGNNSRCYRAGIGGWG